MHKTRIQGRITTRRTRTERLQRALIAALIILEGSSHPQSTEKISGSVEFRKRMSCIL